MDELLTIYSSYLLTDCYILKGRLETEGIPCYIYNEHIVSVDPFYAVAVGGVKIKIPAEFYRKALSVIESLKNGFLIDNNGEYLVSEALQVSIEKSDEILKVKYNIRESPEILYTYDKWKTANIADEDCKEIILEEKLFLELSKKKLEADWNKFLIALFDPDVKFFQYLRPKPVEYFLDKEMVENIQKEDKSFLRVCPYCHSSDVVFNYAIDYKFDILYLLLSLIFYAPFYPIRKKYHCFNCQRSFNRNGNSR
jgi:hypothetical protein